MLAPESKSLFQLYKCKRLVLFATFCCVYIDGYMTDRCDRGLALMNW